MKQLCYQTLQDMAYDGYLLKTAPERVLQFGEGNFLRAFVDYFFDLTNEKHGFNGKVVVVQPIAAGRAEALNQQDGLYTLYLRGMQDGCTVNEKRIISAISRCINPYADFGSFLACAHNPDLRYIVSNTTEAGIVYDPACSFTDAPPASFPAKLTRFLYERYLAFGCTPGKGLVVLSCELIDNNGKELERIVRQHMADWAMEEAFVRWVSEEVLFCSSLVDRIVPGYPRAEAEQLTEENGYLDHSLDFGEIFGAWVIEGPDWLREELPFCQGDLPVQVVPDHTPYKLRKVRILNGAHTGMVLGAYLAGHEIVRQCMQDETILQFMNKMLHEEIIPTLPLDKADLTDFAAAVQDRFGNPFIDHALLSISLNSTAKWRARNMPSLLAYEKQTGKLPRCLTMGLAAYIAFYSQDVQSLDAAGLVCRRSNGDCYTCKDDRWVLEFYDAHKHDTPEILTHAVLTNSRMWGQDLTKIPGLEAAVAADLARIRSEGTAAVFAACL